MLGAGLFLAGALLGSCVTCGMAGLMSSIVPVGASRVVMVVTVGIAVIWYLRHRRIHTFMLSRRQANRRWAEKGPLGVVYFGALLGIGLLTEMSTPLVLCGLASCLSAGAAFGVVYGAGFATGRSGPAIKGAFFGLGPEPAQIAWRLYNAHLVLRFCASFAVAAAYGWLSVVDLG